MLDTNIASYAIRDDHPLVTQRLRSFPRNSLTVSVMTEAELQYGVAKRGGGVGLKTRVDKFLGLVRVLPWTSDVVLSYANLRVLREAAGVTLAPMDMLIAAHAKAIGATLVTSDAAFSFYPSGVILEDWSK
ncbi:type II toxin-antitoxin system VapC family toxin [Duganella sp. S19_KUP01_CR8]|uniref:type II toxin-antitoxin system VapC family toxin n=1 Tax=Duganella sp. S19_KUP01_CR8 TaxID=3025502 RepID=UPI002FCD85B0